MKNKKIWIISIISLIVVAIILAVLLTQKPIKKEEGAIKIGAILPLTGPASDIGDWQKKGMEVASSLINEKGGINGRQVEIVFEDSKGQPKEGVSAFNKLTGINKIAAIFSSLSSVSNAIIPFTKNTQCVLMLISVSFPEITKKGEFIFRDHPGSEDEALEMGNFLFKKLGLRKVVALYCNDDFGIGSYNTFIKKFEEYGGKILWADAYDLTQTEFRNMSVKAKELNPEGIYVIGYVKATVLLIKQLREIGFNGYLSAPMALSTQNFISLGGDSLDGIFFTNTVFDLNSNDLKTKDFVERYRKLYNSDPTVFSGFAYDGMMVLLESIRRKGDGVEKIKEGLLELKRYDGVMGAIEITENRNFKFPLKIVKLDKGKIIPIE